MTGLSRRAVATGLTAFLAIATSAVASAPRRDVRDRLVRVPTADGAVDAALVTPRSRGRYPAVILWPDYGGLRSATRDLARKIARHGYAVLVPHAFHRSFAMTENPVDALDPANAETIRRYRTQTPDEAVARDAAVYLAWLDQRPEVNAARPAATIGFGIGGAFAIMSAAAIQQRIAGVASIYGVAVAASRPTSPHLMIERTRAAYYFAIARDHDTREPGDKIDLREALATAGRDGTVEVYSADRGWADPGAPTFDRAATNRAVRAVVDLLEVTTR